MDPNVKENHSRRLAMTDTLSFMFLGACERLTGDISRGWLLARGLCGVMWVLSLYAMISDISGRRRMALCAATFLTLFYELFVDVLWPVIAAFSPRYGFGVILPAMRYMVIHAFWLLGNYQANFGASRMISPGLNHPPFFFAAFAAWKAARESWTWAVVGGIAGGALAYIHPDVWHIYMAAMGLFCVLWSFAQKKIVWPVWGTFAVAFLLSLPWITANYPMDPEVLERAGGVFTHAVNPSGLLFAVLSAACLYFSGKHPGVIFAAAIFGAIFAAVEAQVLTGYSVNLMRFNSLGLIVAFIALAGVLGRKAQESRHWLYLTAAVFILGAGRTVSYAAQRYPYQGLPSDLEAAFKFLNESTPNDSVVVSLGAQETMLIPVYTHNKTLIGSGYNMTCDIPVHEMIDRIADATHHYGIPSSVLVRRLSEPEWLNPQGMERWMTALWGDRVDWQAREWKNFYTFYTQTLPREEVVSRLQRASAGLTEEADYLWVGPFERELMGPKRFKSLGRPLYENATVAIFKVS
jgi:MFS family permease